MGYQVYWDNPEKTIIHQVFTVGPDWESDFIAAVEESSQLIRSVPHSVDLIIEGSAFSRLRIAGGMLRMAKYVEKHVLPNQRDVVAVGMNMYIVKIVEIARPFARKATEHSHFVATLPEAYALLEKLRLARGDT